MAEGSSSRPTEGPSSNFMSFDNPDPNLSDVTLVVKQIDFYCCKSMLAKNSPYFYFLFFKDSEAKKIDRFELEEPNSPQDFQNFLEVLYGFDAQTHNNVEEILRLGQVFQVLVVMERCVEYLKMDKLMARKRKFDLARMFELEEVKVQILNGIDRFSTIKRIIPSDVMQMDHPTMGMVLRRFIEINDVVDERGAEDLPYHQRRFKRYHWSPGPSNRRNEYRRSPSPSSPTISPTSPSYTPQYSSEEVTPPTFRSLPQPRSPSIYDALDYPQFNFS